MQNQSHHLCTWALVFLLTFLPLTPLEAMLTAAENAEEITRATPLFYTKRWDKNTCQEVVGTEPFTLRPTRLGDVLPTDHIRHPDFFYAERVPLAFLVQMDAYTQQKLPQAPHKSWMLTNSEGEIVGYFNYLDDGVHIHIQERLEKQGLGRQIHQWLLTYYAPYLGQPDLRFTPKGSYTWDDLAYGLDYQTLAEAAAETLAATLEEYFDIQEGPYEGFKAYLSYRNPPALSIFQEGLGLEECEAGHVKAHFPPREENRDLRAKVMELISASQAILAALPTSPEKLQEMTGAREEIRQQLAAFEKNAQEG